MFTVKHYIKNITLFKLFNMVEKNNGADRDGLW